MVLQREGITVLVHAIGLVGRGERQGLRRARAPLQDRRRAFGDLECAGVGPLEEAELRVGGNGRMAREGRHQQRAEQLDVGPAQVARFGAVEAAGHEPQPTLARARSTP